MPGKIVVKPIQAKLETKEGLVSLDPYCVAIVGDQCVRGQVCKKGGTTPSWEDSMTINTGNEPYCYLEVKDKNILKDKMLGVCAIDLDELKPEGRHERWYELYSDKKPVGEILVEVKKFDEGEGMRSSYDSYGKFRNEQRTPGFNEEQTTRASYDVFRDEPRMKDFSGEKETMSYNQFRNEPNLGQIRQEGTTGFRKDLEEMNDQIDRLLMKGRAWEGQERATYPSNRRASENFYQGRENWRQEDLRRSGGRLYSTDFKENTDPNFLQYERYPQPQWNRGQFGQKENVRDFKDRFTHGVEHTEEMSKRAPLQEYQYGETYGIDEERLEGAEQENAMIQKMREVVEEAMEDALEEVMEEAVEEAMEQAVEEAIGEVMLGADPLEVLKETLFGDLFETLEDLEIREQILRDEIRAAELEEERDEEDEEDLGRLTQQERELLRKYDMYDEEKANEYQINLNDMFRNFEEEEEEIFNMLMNDVEQWTQAREEELENKRAYYQKLPSEEEEPKEKPFINLGMTNTDTRVGEQPKSEPFINLGVRNTDLRVGEQPKSEPFINLGMTNTDTRVGEESKPETIYNLGKADTDLKIEVIDPLEQALLDNIYKAYDLMTKEEEPIDILYLRTVVETDAENNLTEGDFNTRTLDYPLRTAGEEGYHRVPNFGICQKPEIEKRDEGSIRKQPLRERNFEGGQYLETPKRAMYQPTEFTSSSGNLNQQESGLTVTSIPIPTDLHSPSGKSFEQLKNKVIPMEISLANEAAFSRVNEETSHMQESFRGSVGEGNFERQSVMEVPRRSGVVMDEETEGLPQKKHGRKLSMFERIYNDFMESARVPIQ